MATLKEFEEALRQQGMVNALAILEQLKKRDRESRSIAPARRVVGRKMTVELARTVLEMHASTGMTQQEIAFKLGVNQGRVNEVIKRGKWLNADPAAAEVVSRDKAMNRLNQRARSRREQPSTVRSPTASIVEATVRKAAAQPPRAAATELPLDEPSCSAQTAVTLVATKQPLRRFPSEAAPIVSAQLAFLDL